MKKARQYWHTNHSSRGEQLVLGIEVEVNGELLRAQLSVAEDFRYGGPPPAYFERELRSMLMRDLEERLLGPRR